MKYLLDTMVVSEPTKRKKEPKVMQWLAAHDHDCAISVLTLGEVERGIVDMAPSKRRHQLMAWLASFADHMEERGRILAVDRKLMSFWGPVYCREERLTKRKPPFVNTILAATAEMHGLTMVTRNTKDFPASLPIINPWE